MELMIVEILFKALILAAILYIVARHEADFEFSKVAMVVAGITLGTFLIDALLTPKIGLFSVIPSIAFVTYMVVKFCWVRVWKGLIVTIIFIAINIGLNFAVLALFRDAGKAGDEVLDRANQEQEENLKELKALVDANEAMYQKQMQNMGITSPPMPVATSGGMKPVGFLEEMSKSAPPPEPKKQAPAKKSAQTPAASAAAGGFATEDSPYWESSRAQLRVTARATAAGGKPAAFVNGEMITEGAVVNIRYEGQIYRWRAKAIGPRSIEWEPYTGAAAKPAGPPDASSLADGLAE